MIMEKWKEEYKAIRVPEQMGEKLEEAVKKAQEEKKRTKTINIWKKMGSVAAVLAILLILPNTSEAAASAMQNLPIVGNLFKIVTIREYQVDEGGYTADVQVPQVTLNEEENSSDIQADQALNTINFDVQAVTDELIRKFEEDMEAYGEDGGFENITVNSQILTDTDQYFSMELSMYQSSASGYEEKRHYTIDKYTGELVQLSDFYGEDYVNIISEEVKEQMRARMEEDDNQIYWIDQEDMPENDFQEIRPDQDFYVNADGKVVICFAEYEAAPGYMGCVTFEMP
jgi:hypothetical protein